MKNFRGLIILNNLFFLEKLKSFRLEKQEHFTEGGENKYFESVSFQMKYGWKETKLLLNSNNVSLRFRRCFIYIWLNVLKDTWTFCMII